MAKTGPQCHEKWLATTDWAPEGRRGNIEVVDSSQCEPFSLGVWICHGDGTKSSGTSMFSKIILIDSRFSQADKVS